MFLYHINNNKLTPIKKVEIKKERDLQNITEANLNQIFNLRFIASEFQVDNFRIDTLAFNEETNAFVIIEYKKNQNYSVIDQGYSYLSILLNNKAEFILKYNENSKESIGKNDVDWSQSTILFVAPKFNTYQLKAIEFNDIPFELWEISKFSNNTLLFNKINTSNSNASIKTVSNITPTTNEVNKEIKVYSEEDHILNKSEDAQDFYREFKDRIFNEFPNSEIYYTKYYFGFKNNNTIFCTCILQQNLIKVWFTVKGKLDDYKNLTRDVSNIGHHGLGNYEIKIPIGSDLNYPLSLIKQAYDEINQ